MKAFTPLPNRLAPFPKASRTVISVAELHLKSCASFFKSQALSGTSDGCCLVIVLYLSFQNLSFSILLKVIVSVGLSQHLVNEVWISASSGLLQFSILSTDPFRSAWSFFHDSLAWIKLSIPRQEDSVAVLFSRKSFPSPFFDNGTGNSEFR
jgi:hypothetical protein